MFDIISLCEVPPLKKCGGQSPLWAKALWAVRGHLASGRWAGGCLAGDFLYVIYLCYYILFYSLSQMKNTCLNMAIELKIKELKGL